MSLDTSNGGKDLQLNNYLQGLACSGQFVISLLINLLHELQKVAKKLLLEELQKKRSLHGIKNKMR